MSLEKLKAFINDAADVRLEERLGDTDAGLDVKPTVIKARRSYLSVYPGVFYWSPRSRYRI